jgi:U3 small nucleolar RNA-associated protein 18
MMLMYFPPLLSLLFSTDCVQLFFLDAGAAETSGALVLQPGTPESDEDQNEPAVWADSDDERMAISLAGHQRLRKLRDTEAEDVVSGKEYIKRLRRQYLRLHPTPGWANPAVNSKRRKHTANSSDDDSEENASSEGEDGMDTDDEADLSVQPLARLLQGAGDLIRGSEEIKGGGRRNLRQEVIDIQRLKDVGGVQPVSFQSFFFI